ncbi:MAG TPA: cupin domain-containing protein [Allosphingosinicella sp.]|jgi:uncharacterized cupin superfamily protein
MPKIDLDAIEPSNKTTYPMPFAADMGGRYSRRLAPATGLTDFGASHVTLEPGGISSQRHWHVEEDELVIMLSGEAVLIEDEGETPMRAGDLAVFPKGAPNGHHLVNRSDSLCVFVAIGRPPVNGMCYYSDVDLVWDGLNGRFTHRDGTPY